MDKQNVFSKKPEQSNLSRNSEHLVDNTSKLAEHDDTEHTHSYEHELYRITEHDDIEYTHLNELEETKDLNIPTSYYKATYLLRILMRYKNVTLAKIL